MYGYSVPRYVRDYERDWQTHDRFLRVRRSLDHPGMYLVERKTRYVHAYPFRRGTDRQVQLKDEYRPVFPVWPCDLRYVQARLKSTDIQAHGGAKELAAVLDAQEDHELARADRAFAAELDARSSEVYDHFGWAERRKVTVL